MPLPLSPFNWTTVLPVVLDALNSRGPSTTSDLVPVVQTLAEKDFPDQAQRQLKHRSVAEDRTRWAIFNGRHLGFITTISHGVFSITDEGSRWVETHPYPLSREEIAHTRSRANEAIKSKQTSSEDDERDESSDTDRDADFAWVLRTGRDGERERAALERNQGLPGMDYGPLTNAAPALAEIKSAMRTEHPEMKAGTISNLAGQLNRFKNEMQMGDLVLMPSKHERNRIYYGYVSGPYEYRPEAPVEFRHVRPIEWASDYFYRDDLGEDLKNSLGALQTLLKIKRNNAFERLNSVIAGLGDPDALSSDEHSAAPSFDWVPFFGEFARKLLDYSSDREPLLSALRDAANLSHRPSLFKHLWTWYTEQGAEEANDIDPFTVLGTLARQISDPNRIALCSAIKETFNLQAPVPHDFSGLPRINNLNSRFEAKTDDVGNKSFYDGIWKLLDAALAHSSQPSAENAAAFTSSFDNATASRGMVRYTMVLFMASPNVFLSLDSVNSRFLGSTAALGRNPSTTVTNGQEYLDFIDEVRAYIADSEIEPATLYALSYEAWDLANAAEAGESITAAEEPDEDERFTIDDLLEQGCFIPREEIELMMNRLREKKNLILQGPPGTGKTWVARQLAHILCGTDSDESTTAVQFHPSMSYEDFIQGFRPSGDGKLTLAKGPLLKAVDKANEDETTPHVVVIEEINRGNPAQIFGDMLTLLEADKRNPENALTTLYSPDGETIFLPKNLYIIGTMNQADRSLAMLDMALRRRFAFITLRPQLNASWRRFCIEHRRCNESALVDIAQRINTVNELISDDFTLGPAYEIGHSFVTPLRELKDSSYATTMMWFANVIESELKPLLTEYWFDNSPALENALRVLR